MVKSQTGKGNENRGESFITFKERKFGEGDNYPKKFRIGIVLLMRKGEIMAISYNGLWKLLIDNGMNKGELCKKTGLSSSTMAKMTNGESVKLSVLERICKELNCNFADLVDYVDDSKVKKEK